MQKNESSVDRVIRAIVGIIIIYFAHASLMGFLAFIGYVIGIILLFTAVTGYCYLYTLLKISTKK